MKIYKVSKFISNFTYFNLFKKLREKFIGTIFNKLFCILVIKIKSRYIRCYNSVIDYFLIGLIKGYRVFIELRGTGYKVKLISNNCLFGLILRLGFSHLIYIQLFKNFRVSFFNRSTLCFYSNNFYSLRNQIRSICLQKKINIYKGKGIF